MLSAPKTNHRVSGIRAMEVNRAVHQWCEPALAEPRPRTRPSWVRRPGFEVVLVIGFPHHTINATIQVRIVRPTDAPTTIQPPRYTCGSSRPKPVSQTRCRMPAQKWNHKAKVQASRNSRPKNDPRNPAART